jgi:hypothetical protein
MLEPAEERPMDYTIHTKYDGVDLDRGLAANFGHGIEEPRGGTRKAERLLLRFACTFCLST